MAGHCILCGRALTHAAPPEHILPDCLGGRLKSKRVLCAVCNRDLGMRVDAPLSRLVAGFRIWHGLPSGSRNRLPDGTGDPTSPDFSCPAALMALTKMTVMLWGHRVGEAEMRQPCWDDAKACLAKGEPSVETETPLWAPTARLLTEDFGPLSHRVWVFSDQQGRVIGGGAFYGQCGRSLLLCRGGAAPLLHLLLACNPASPAHWKLYFSQR